MKFTKDHEWLKQDADIVTVGITDFAQQQLGEVVFVDLPDVGADIAQGEEVCVVESVKAAGDVKSPIAGSVTEVNDELDGNPELINEDPHGNGWLYKVKASGEADADLMDEAAYQAFVASLE